MKVYLGKSNKADNNVVSDIRHYLSSKLDLEVLEYTGGAYDSSLLDDADYHIFIPDNFSNVVDLGLGLYRELEKFSGTSYCVSMNEYKEYILKKCFKSKVTNTKDKTKYAIVLLDNDGLEFEEVFKSD